MPSRRLILVLAVVAVLVTGTVVEAMPEATAGLVHGIPEDEAIGITNNQATRFALWSYGSLPVCLDARGSVVLQSVHALTAGPVAIDRVGVRLLGDAVAVGSMPGKLPSTFDEVRGFRVTSRCAGGPVVELALSLRRTGPGPSSVRKLELTYTQGSLTYVAPYQVTIVLCDGPAPAMEGSIAAACDAA